MSPSDAPNVEVRGTSFVGRWAELEWLEEQVQEARAGQPRIVLITGDAGVGKSRLTREVVSRLDDAAISAGRCRETMRVAYSPFRDSLFPLIDAYLVEHPEHGRHVDLTDRLIDIREVAPADAPELEARTHQRLVSAAVLAVEMARQQMLVIVLDDLHWADDPTLGLLEALAGQMADASLSSDVPILVVATLRPVADEVRQAAIERLRREPIASSLHLEGLPRLDMAALAQLIAGRTLTDRELTTLLETTRGNPLFAEAVLRHGDDEWLPVHIREAMAAPLRGLSIEVRELLEAASFIDDLFTPDLLANVVDRDAASVRQQLDEGARLRIVERGPDGWVFTHPLYRQVLQELSLPATHERVHARIAEAIEGGVQEPDLRALAHHLARAGDQVDESRLVQAAMAAGRLEFGACNWARACDHLLVVDERCKANAELAGPLAIDLAELHHLLGQSLVFQGEVEAGLAHHDAAAGRYRDRDDAASLLAVIVSRCQAEVAAGQLGIAVDDAELWSALRRVRTESPGVAADAVATVAQLHWLSGRLDEANTVAAEAIELAIQARSPDPEVLARMMLAMVAWTRFEPRTAKAQLERARVVAAGATHPARRVGPLNRLPITLLWLGELGEAASCAEAALEFGDSIRFRRELGLPLTASAMVDALQGDAAHAEHLVERALTVDRLTSYAWPSVFAQPLLSVLCDLQGRPHQAEAALADLDAMMGPTSNWTRAARLLHLAATARVRTPSDAELIEADVGLDPDGIAPSIGAAGLAAAHVELADALDRPALAAHARQVLEVAEERGLVYIGSVAILVERVLGKARALEGDIDFGIQTLGEALERARGDAAALEIARSSRDLAVALETRGAKGDSTRAASLHGDHAELLRVLDLRGLHGTIHAPAGPDRRRDGSYTTQVVMFADVCGSTQLIERLGDVAYARHLRDVLSRVHAIAADHEGRVVNHTGDGALITFDSAGGAIECAFDCHAGAGSDQMQLHFGVHAGEVVELDGNVFGAAVHAAARLCDQAGLHETVVSDAVRVLAGDSAAAKYHDRGQPQLKGVSQPIRLFDVEPV